MSSTLDKAAPEVWGGVECTVNRVGDRYHDQLLRSDHLARLEDIERFAALGLKALRIPVIWERSCTDATETPSFAWCAPMLERVQKSGMRAIAGLVHHGSGPRFTDLLDPEFAPKLARYAGAVAARFPEIADYTPVNEPLTTARFSGLYGHWYPHARDTSSFLRALFNECRATVLAMQAIRKVRPDAQLVQTEDVATVRSTHALAHQAEYENDRRFLSLDLLCGRIDSDHPLYDHLREHGIAEDELALFRQEPCPPDVIGINYYFTSDRYLDEQLADYAAWSHGGNGRDQYADIDAGHVKGVGLSGHEQILRAVWERYRLPLAITEVHAGCTREEQLRWLHEAWTAACRLREQQVPVLAVAAWALLGSYDWNSLVCREAGVYETGVYDLRGTSPRPTALAHMLKGLAHDGRYEHPVLSSRGWWTRVAHPELATHATSARPILITGGLGTLAKAFARACEARGLAYRVFDRTQLDITDAVQVGDVLDQVGPWAVINASGFVRADEAEATPQLCRVNIEGPTLLAAACRKHSARLLCFSSDQVFDGSRNVPYLESDLVAPLSVYGASQAEAERLVLALYEDAFIVRTSSLFGSGCPGDTLMHALRVLAYGRTVSTQRSETCSPTYVPHLVDACLDLLIDGARGRWHLANVGQESWSGLTRRVAARVGLPGERVVDVPFEQVAPRAPRPKYSVLNSEHGCFMPTLEQAIDQLVREGHVRDLGGARAA